ncbi:Toxin RelE [Anaerolineae bacterium]|nr:Toxin RelE [Anaerolineae bacterium]
MYELILSPDAEKALSKLQRSDRKLFKQIASAIDQLAGDPFLGKPLVENLKGFHSYRVRDYRILYEIENKFLRVLILQIQHRKEVYR